MDNIFVTDGSQSPANTSAVPNEKDAHWLLADLGNVRQHNHSYHSSLLWAHDNGQNTDCRTNDVVRLLKSYLLFIQSSLTPGNPRNAFNGDFLAASAPWSRLYWYTINSAHGNLDGATAARQILEISTGVFAPGEPPVETELAQAVNIYSEDEDWESSTRPRIQRTSWSEWIWASSDRSTQEAALVVQELRMGLRASERWAKIYGTFGILPIPSEQC